MLLENSKLFGVKYQNVNLFQPMGDKNLNPALFVSIVIDCFNILHNI